MVESISKPRSLTSGISEPLNTIGEIEAVSSLVIIRLLPTIIA